MRLVEVLNTIAGHAAWRPSSLASPAPGSAAPAGMAARSSSSAGGNVRGGAAPAAPPLPPPMSAAAAAAHPALRAAEEALEARLANGAAACDQDFIQLHFLNEALFQERSFAAAEACRELNRYCNVLPYDDCRIRLGRPFPFPSPGGGAAPAAGGAAGAEADGDGPLRAEYVNASPLRGGEGGGEQWAYIASQGPLRHTRDAFWQMVTEQGCSAVIMLTNGVECGVTKCASYFPTQPRTAKALGRFTVQTSTVEEVLPDLHRRSLTIKDSQQQAQEQGQPEQQGQQQGQQGQQGAALRPHRLLHYHYTAWPDHGVPPSPEPLLRLCAELRAGGAHAAPILVHCSAGIGRSGVFCVMDVISRRLLALVGSRDAAAGAAAVDVAALVADLRRQRLGMVQTRDQFVFCHAALLHFLRQLAAQQAQQA